MNRRRFIVLTACLSLVPVAVIRTHAREAKIVNDTQRLLLGDQEWKQRLTSEQYHILRQEGTERPWTSPLLKEKRPGTYVCVACDHPLFDAVTKYDSGTGWPSFYDTLEGAFETETDYKLIWPRTEYHCARCGGHHGHVFKDGPEPTGLRYCNNGLALEFVPGGEGSRG